MRLTVMLGLSLFVLASLNYGIFQKEQIKKNGETVLLELAPVDPRSLMQGDYMRLRYAIERIADDQEQKISKKRGYMVITADENKIGQFVRFHNGEPLGEQEKLLYFHHQYDIRIVPDTFMFQEGHAKFYEEAKYGIFKFSDDGKILLVGLADENRKEITINTPNT